MSSLPNGAEGPNVVRSSDGEGSAIPLLWINGRLHYTDAEGELQPWMGYVRAWSDYSRFLDDEDDDEDDPEPDAVPAMTANPIADALRAMTLGLKAAWKANKSSIPDWRVRALPIGMILQILAWVLPFIVAWLQRNPAQLPALMSAGPREIPQAIYAAVAEGEGQV